MYTFKSILPIILFISCTITSCISPEKEFSMGEIEDNVYSNSFFDTKIHIPNGWSIQTRESIETITKIGQDIFSGDNENSKSFVNPSEVKTATLLNFFRHQIGTSEEYNHNFMLIVENIASSPEINSGKKYLDLNKDILRKAQIKYGNLEEEIKETSIGNKTFFTMNPYVDYTGVVFHQKFYTAIINDFAFIIIISYQEEEQKEELEKIVNAIEFL